MNKYFLITSLGLLSCGATLFGFADGDRPAPAVPAPVLVEVDGVKLTLADYGRKHPGGMFQATQSFYQAQRKAVAEFVDEYLFEREAKKEGITVEQLLDRHVNSAGAKEISEEAIRVYYDGVDTEESYESLRQRIIDHIKEGRITKAKAAYLKQLHSQAHINLQFGPPRAQVNMKDAVVRGPADAPVTIVEYADYECPYCQQAQPVVTQVEADYKGKVAFAFKDMPLPNHVSAPKAAEASRCAATQGKYWEYHDLLFKTKALDVKDLKNHARELNLDAAAFDKCLDSGAQADAIKAQFNEGVGFGLQGTPGFFINGRFVSGVLTVEQFHSLIDEELATSGRVREAAKR
jgi:protein-disulfide isomerase